MEFDFTITNEEEVRKRLLAAPDNLKRKVLGTALLRGAYLIRNQARALAPRGTGLLASRIVATRGRLVNPTEMNAKIGVRMTGKGRRAQLVRTLRQMGKRGLVKLQGSGFDDPFYWRYLEFGTVRMRARSFLAVAARNQAGAAVAKVQEEIINRIDVLTEPK